MSHETLQEIQNWKTPSGLVENDRNMNKILTYLRQHNAVFSVHNLNTAVEALKNQLEWGAPVKQGSTFDALANLGIKADTAHQTVREKQEEDAQRSQAYVDARAHAAKVDRQRERQKELSNIAAHQATTGQRINWAKTRVEQAEMLAELDRRLPTE